MTAHIIKLLIALAGLINFLPVIGVLSKTRLEKLYGIEIDNAHLEILMRHRAVLFGVIGGFMIFAAFRESWHIPAILIGVISMLSFVVLAISVGAYGPEIKTIIRMDYVGLGLLAIAVILKVIK